MKTKNIFTRFICFFLVFALILPMMPTMVISAANDTLTVLIWKEPVEKSESADYDTETINEIIADEPNVKKYDSKSNNNWYLSEYGAKRVLGELKRCGEQIDFTELMRK